MTDPTTTHEISLDPGESVRVTQTDPNARLVIESRSRMEIIAESMIRPRPDPEPEPEPDPEPEPEPTGDNLIANGRLEDADGNASLAGWEQGPAWFNTHAPVKGSPSGTHYIQADRDFRPGVVNVWKGGNPSTAEIWTETAADLPEHSEVWLSWETAHHLREGVATWELSGRNASDEPWGPARSYDIVEGVPGDKRPRVVPPQTVAVFDGGFRQYRLRAVVTLASDEDGIVFGDVRLTVK